MKALRLLKAVMDRVLQVCAVLAIVTMLAVVVVQVFSRFALPRTPPWTEEATRFLFIAAVGLAAGLAVREKAFVNVDTLIERLSPNGRRVLGLLMKVITVAFMIVILRYSIPFIRLGTRQASASLLIPMAFPFSMTFTTAFFIGVYTLIDIASEVVALLAGPAAKKDV